MPEPIYPTIRISSGMILADEQMGSKDKYWCDLPEELGGGRWLFKEPRAREGNMEHLAEKLAQEFADLIHISCARIELAEFEDIRGSISKSILEEGEELVHGNEIIAGRVVGYDPDAKGKSSVHTYGNIQTGIRAACGGRCEQDLNELAGYLVLDALIGNTDRHHENWALLRRDLAQGSGYRLAPSFDHASSLGRELSDKRRLLLLREKRVGEYIQDGAGGVFISDEPVPPLVLVEQLSRSFAGVFQPWLSRIECVTDAEVDRIIHAVPAEWITEPQAEFAKAVVCYSRDYLTQLVK